MLCFERMVLMSIGCVFVFFLFLRHTACAGPQLVPNKAASPVLGRLRQREAARRLMQRDGRPMQRDGRLMQRDVNAGGEEKVDFN